jgi:hypothetical protein
VSNFLKRVGMGLFAVTLLSLSLPLASFADTAETTMNVINIKVPVDAVSDVKYPVITLKSDKAANIIVENQTGTTARFKMEEAGVDVTVPWYSSVQVTVDPSKAGEDKLFGYSILDARGGSDAVLASGSISTGSTIPQIAFSQANFDNFINNATQTLQDLIQRNQYTAVEFPPDDEPRVQQTYTEAPTKKVTRVRGYW